jgi:hypothetical protein
VNVVRLTISATSFTHDILVTPNLVPVIDMSLLQSVAFCAFVTKTFYQTNQPDCEFYVLFLG